MDLTLTRKPKTQTDAGPFTPGPPRVNLVPPSSVERAAEARARKVALAAWGASLLAVMSIWAVGMSASGNANTQLSGAKAQSASLALDLARYAPVTTIAQQTQALNATVAAQTASEVDHSEVISRFMAAIGTTMTVDSLQVSTDNSAGCVSTDPFQQVPLVGCVTFTGTAPGGPPAASQIITSLVGDTWFIDPFIPSVGAAGQDGTPLAGSVGLTMEAYAKPPVIPTDPAATTTGPTASPTATTGPGTGN